MAKKNLEMDRGGKSLEGRENMESSQDFHCKLNLIVSVCEGPSLQIGDLETEPSKSSPYILPRSLPRTTSYKKPFTSKQATSKLIVLLCLRGDPNDYSAAKRQYTDITRQNTAPSSYTR